MRRWELWNNEWDVQRVVRSQTFFPEENDQARRMAQDDGERFVWETTPKSYNDAMRAMYLYKGWGEYNPILREDGTPDPAGEDDDYVDS